MLACRWALLPIAAAPFLGIFFYTYMLYPQARILLDVHFTSYYIKNNIVPLFRVI